MIKSKRKIAMEDNGLTLCRSGEDLFSVAPLKKYITEIKNVVSCPRGIFEPLYLTTLYRLGEFCQTMPFSEKEFSKPYGLIERQLQLAVATLKLRRGLLLPKNAGAETIATDEAQWTYAIFLTALFRDIHQVQHDRSVNLYYDNGEMAGHWAPLSGSLYENNFYYRMQFVPQKRIENTTIFMAALSGRLVPPMAFRWLSSNAVLSQMWWDCILHRPLPACEINTILEEAAQKLGISLLQDDAPKESSQHEWFDHFTGWITPLIKYNPDSLFRLKEGLFITEEIMDDYFAENASLSKPNFLQQLQKENRVIMSNESIYHSLSPKKFEDRRVLRGVILHSDFLPDVLNMLPLNTHFQEHISF